MKELWQAILQDWLPTKWSRLIAGVTVTLTGAAFYLPEGLLLLGSQLTPNTTLLVRCTAPLFLLSLGLFVLLACVVLHYRSLRLASEQFKEYKGAFFKRKNGGGYHEAVYCGTCKSPTAPEGKVGFLDDRFICQCGWKSSFNVGGFNNFFLTLKP